MQHAHCHHADDHGTTREIGPGRGVVLIAGLLTILSAPVVHADELTLASPNQEVEGRFGRAISGIPDINGDGHDDLIVGASGETAAGLDSAGRVYLISGATGEIIRLHSSPNDTFGGQFGRAVAGVDDLNNDGRGDYVVGAPGELGDAGRVYVYSGANGALLRTHISPNDEPGGQFGWSVSGVPDTTGDNRGEYVVGAPDEDHGGIVSRGRAYLFSGGTGNVLWTRACPIAESFAQYGWDVAGVPDTNGDNRGDVLIGAPGATASGHDEAGRAWLYSGLNSLQLHAFQSANPQPFGHYGWSVAGTEDVGGNGLGDVIIGAPDEDRTVDGMFYDEAGRAYLYSGTGGFLAHTYVEPDANAGSDSRFGADVAGLADVDGDNLADVIVGAPGWPGYFAYVILADSEVIHRTLSTPDDFGSNQLWGAAVTGIGDLNGDGRGDYAVGGSGSDDFPEGPSMAGRVSLYRPVINDTCFGAGNVELFEGDNYFSTIGAAEGASESCSAFQDPGPDTWYVWEASCTGTLLVNTCDANYNTKIAVYDGCGAACVAAVPIACNDNSIICGFGDTQSWLSVPVVGGQCYRIRIGGANNESGDGLVNLSCIPCVESDLNGDNIVDAADLSILLSVWGTDNSVADLNFDGVVDSADLAFLLSQWGQSC